MAPSAINLESNPSQKFLFVSYEQDGATKEQRFDFADPNSRSSFMKFTSWALKSGINFRATGDENAFIPA